MRQKLEDCLKESCERYSRYHVLTQGAWKAALEYPWEGNLFQIENFCERLILTADRRSIDEVGIHRLLGELYPAAPDKEEGQFQEETRKEEPVPDSYMSDGERELYEALRRYDGSRQKTAEALGISKATLWRKMKKYGMEYHR